MIPYDNGIDGRHMLPEGMQGLLPLELLVFYILNGLSSLPAISMVSLCLLFLGVGGPIPGVIISNPNQIEVR